ncbi:MAG: IS66 family insertion sequence element accessory protein TnpA [Oligoflexus sp.]
MIEAYRASGRTAVDFCKKHAFIVHTLKNQIYNLNQGSVSKEQTNAFVELLPALPNRPRFITLSTSSGRFLPNVMLKPQLTTKEWLCCESL